jgi:hypothetical protein
MTPTLVDRTLAPRDDCPDPAVEFVADGADGTDADAPAVVVRGCVTGRNGCAEARLVDAAYDSAADRLSVVVGAVVERDPDAVCTQALTPRGYEATLAFEGGLPGAATVVHDDVDGRRTAVEATR